VPVEIVGGISISQTEIEAQHRRAELFRSLIRAVEEARDANKSIVSVLGSTLRNDNVPDFMAPSDGNLPEANLCPVGLMHLYRQLYFAGEEGLGPIEEAFTVAPLETLEIFTSTIRRQIHEEMVEVGSETISQTAQELKDQDEVTDKVSSMIQRDNTAAFSAEGGANLLVWHAGASANVSLSSSAQRSRDTTTRHLREVTQSASQRIRQTVTIRTTSQQDIATTATSHRVIRNESSSPVSYGLRRVLRKVRVQVQYLGPRAVWQLYLRNPGVGLARSQFVLFREAKITPPPDMPPDMPPRPHGGTDTGSASCAITTAPPPPELTGQNVLIFKVLAPADRVITAVSIDSLVDLGGNTKSADDPAAKSGATLVAGVAGSRDVVIPVKKGSSDAVTVNYSYTWEPSDDVVTEWDTIRKTKQAAITEERLQEQFERGRDLITARSKVRPRPAADLRREERYEVMNRMISQLFGRPENPGGPTPLEIEYFHQFFNIDGIFTFTHPSWWKPRYAASMTSLEREPYEITADGEPAPLGSSLGWLLQLDGDSKRNEFLNSPWVRVCLPMRPEREREAAEWLASHVEGTTGFDSPAVDGLLTDIETFRQREASLGRDGPDYVAIDSTLGAEPGDPTAPATAPGVYPVVDRFDVIEPTPGLVYDSIEPEA